MRGLPGVDLGLKNLFWSFTVGPFAYALFVLHFLLRRIGLWPTPGDEECHELFGKIVIVTGANTGVGLATAASLARQGATVVMACRDVKKAQAAAANIAATSNVDIRQVIPMALDLADLSSVASFAAAFLQHNKSLHALVCNGGVPGSTPGLTSEGHDMAFGVSFTGHFVLVRGLLPLLQKTPGARVVTLSSVMHWFGQPTATADWSMAATDSYPLRLRLWHSSYSDAKTALVLLAAALRTRGVHAVAVNPGAVASDIWRYLPTPISQLWGIVGRLAFLTTREGAVPAVHAAAASPPPPQLYLTPYLTHPRLQQLELVGPFAGVRPCASRPELEGPEALARDAERLWRWADEMVVPRARQRV